MIQLMKVLNRMAKYHIFQNSVRSLKHCSTMENIAMRFMTARYYILLWVFNA